MYAAKRSNQRIVVYEPTNNYSPLGHLTMVTELRKAMSNGEFELYYQPQIDLKTNRVIAVEALGRWMHSRYGLVKPEVYISELEQIGMIEQYTTWAIETATAGPALVRSATRKLVCTSRTRSRPWA